MKLVISEYLSLLKESDELDSLLPDLLLSMSAETISHAQKGVSQYGVDVAAISDHEDGIKTLYLFLIKQGDIGRTDWSAEKQSIRQSLDDIKYVYISSHIRPEHSKLRKKIVVCTGGKLKQDTQQRWSGYTQKSEDKGNIEYDFWGGDKLSLLIEQYMFNEKILPQELQSRMRKTLALLSDPDYKLSDYYFIVEELLLNSNLHRKSLKNIEKHLRTVHLCLNIIFFWSQKEGNLKPSIYCAEKTLLTIWEFIRRNNFYNKKTIGDSYFKVLSTLFSIYSNYFNKIQEHCHVYDGLTGYGRDFILENLNIFETLGFISVAGLLYIYQSDLEEDPKLYESATAISESTIALIKNNPITKTPCYDSHIIEISAVIHLLAITNNQEFINSWVKDIVDHIAFAYRNMSQYFPVMSDSFDDLIELNISESIDKEKLMEMSTLLPILAQWCATLELEETYTFIRNAVKEVFPKCTLQIWYPDKETDQFLYTTNAANESGASDSPIALPDTIDEMRTMLKKVQKNTVLPEDISAIKHGLAILPIIASRHFRTPFLPLYWQAKFIERDDLKTTEIT